MRPRCSCQRGNGTLYILFGRSLLYSCSCSVAVFLKYVFAGFLCFYDLHSFPQGLLLRTNILPRLRYLLEVCSLPSTAVAYVFDVLLRFSDHSLQSCADVCVLVLCSTIGLLGCGSELLNLLRVVLLTSSVDFLLMFNTGNCRLSLKLHH